FITYKPNQRNTSSRDQNRNFHLVINIFFSFYNPYFLKFPSNISANNSSSIHFQSYRNRSLIYNETDGDGWCFMAYCSAECENGETWNSGNCTIKTCVNGSTTSNPVPCAPAKPPVCENGRPPVKVYDESGCCFQYQCQCECYGWGDPHIVTFDGTYYSFQENCTYVLVKEINPVYNFKVLIDNVYCGAQDGVSCPHSLIVQYNSYEVIFVQSIHDTTTVLAYVNKKQIFPAYSNADFLITNSGIQMTMVIPKINAQVMFSGMLFKINLPYSQFHGNTEGHCGTCDNTQKNDCRLPDGRIHPSCSEMAKYWSTPDKNKPYCGPSPTVKPGPLTTKSPATTTTVMCKPKICDFLVFEECHKTFSAEAFHKACKFDVCNMPNPDIACHSFEMYAIVCASSGMCIDWRKATNGTCGCTGPDGMPRMPGETWMSDCLKCECEPDSMSVQCYSPECPPPDNVTCAEEGQVMVTETVNCCPQTKCGTPAQNCNVHKNSTYLSRDGCRSISPVEITSCEGSCVTSSMYSAKASAMMHSCSCCQEMSTSMREMKMKCPNGITVTHSYVYIETCGCYVKECENKN
ncbi:hypothetical protein Z043_120957, partial [Scleropages formosus]